MPKFAGAVNGKHLGRKPPTDEMRCRTLPLKNFVNLAARPVPIEDDYASMANDCLNKMMGNDREGCCVATALAKMLGVHNSYRPGGKVIVATDAEVSKWYHAVGGPGDNGLYSPDALNYLRDKGMSIGGVVHKIEGFAAVDPTNGPLLDAAFHWFGGLYYGVNLTSRQYQHAENTDTWDIDGTGIVGGHAIPFTKRSPTGGQLATWARQPQATRRLMQSARWADEVYVIFGPDWFNSAGIDVNNVNIDALRSALAALKAGGTPVIPDDPNPPIPPPVPPVPPTPGQLQATGVLDFFGQELKMQIVGAVGAGPGGTRGVNYWNLLLDLAAIAAAWKAKDWVALATAVETLLIDLGLRMSAAEYQSVAAAIANRAAVSTITNGCPPQ